MNKKTLFFSLILIIAIAVSSWMAVNVARSMLKQPIADKDDGDFFMTDVEYTQMDENGEARNKINTMKVDHYPADDQYIFKTPHITMIGQDDKFWRIEAKRGLSGKNGEVVTLLDNVKITQLAKSSNQTGMVVKTSAATIYFKENVAKTDQPVVIEQGDSVVNSVGAEMNFKSSSVKLLSKVQGQYEAGK